MVIAGAIAGESSGVICAFNAALVHAGEVCPSSLCGRQFHIDPMASAGETRGRECVSLQSPQRTEAEHSRRMSDGNDDLENNHGSWPMQNIQMANSLKLCEYDFHFRFGTAVHGGAQASPDLPGSLAWLWRDYNPKKSSEEFQIEPSEKEKPFFRVTITNRDAW